RSFLAFVLAPQTPVDDWIDGLDVWVARSKGFFHGRPVLVDFSHVDLTRPEVAGLLAQLQARNLRIIGVEGVNPAWVGPGLGPLPGGGKPAGAIEVPGGDETAPGATGKQANGHDDSEPTALVIDNSVRSGQSIIFPNGDVTVTGSVASGAELIAGGSIHVYGCLRGRAIAGSKGNTRARIFCNSFEAELLAIGGLYKTADDVGPDLRGRAIQAWLDGEMLMTTAQG
ncbi:MAG TPA: septum site-determining protein MinC, partial [Afifellaceae bacterium]|nr:septum site-determining protein MinC [Afifellaceae bacterium]